MTTQTATDYQRVEDCLTAAACSLERALSVLATLPGDCQQSKGLLRLLRAAQLLEAAGDVLADRFEDATLALAPEAAAIDF